MHLQNIEKRGQELQHLINYAKNVLHNLTKQKSICAMKKNGSKASALKRVSDTPDEGLNVVSAAPNGKQLFGIKNSIQYNENDDLLENEQEIQADKVQLSNFVKWQVYCNHHYFLSDEEDVEGDTLEKQSLRDYSKMQIVDAIDSLKIEIGSISNFPGFIGDDSFDIDNANDVKRQLSLLKDMALHLKSEEGEEELAAGQNNEQKSLVGKNRTRSSKYTLAESQKLGTKPSPKSN